MVAQSSGCDPNRLRLLLRDRLSSEQQAAVVGHLDCCTACQKALETLAAESVWWQRLRQFATGDQTAVSAVSKSNDKAPLDGKHAPREIAAGEEGISLDFLELSDDPAHLGRLGRFAVTEVLGHGGMGIVLKAFDAALNRPVAIKVLAPHLATSGAARKRFAREAQAAAAVVHDHVVPIHSVDTWKGLPYLVMSYVPGQSLQQRLDSEGPLDVKEILRIGMQTAFGLAAAHAQGLVHRDIKPGNILLENGVQRVRITDFGLARAIDDASLSQSGIVAGTPPYMSPEQARGEAVDHRSDLFSLGSTLYAMCTGHAPFRANSAMAVLLRIRDEQPRSVCLINADIPDWLVAILEKLHAKDPRERFQSAGDVAHLLERCLAHVRQPGAYSLPRQITQRNAAGRASVHFRWLLGILLGIALGGSSVVAVGWKPFGDWFAPTQRITEESHSGGIRVKPTSGNDAPEEALHNQLQEVGRQSQRLESELRQPVAPPRSNDSALPWLREARARLDQLERELGAATPNR